MVMKWPVLLTGTLALLSLTSWAQQPAFVIREMSVDLPYITVYVDVPEENGKPVRFEASDISAVTLQGQSLKPEVVSVKQGFAYTFLLVVPESMRIRKDFRDAIRAWIDKLH